MHLTFSEYIYIYIYIYIIYRVVLLSPFLCYNLDQDFQFVCVNFVELRVPAAVSLIEKARGMYHILVC